MKQQTEQTVPHQGPSLLALAVVYTLLVAGIVSGLLLKHGVVAVNPYSSPEESRRFFADNPAALRVAAFFSFGSSVPLGIYAATIVSRLRFLGVRAAGSYIALFGGFSAAILLAISALCAWLLAVPEVSASRVLKSSRCSKLPLSLIPKASELHAPLHFPTPQLCARLLQRGHDLGA